MFRVKTYTVENGATSSTFVYCQSLQEARKLKNKIKREWLEEGYKCQGKQNPDQMLWVFFHPDKHTFYFNRQVEIQEKFNG